MAEDQSEQTGKATASTRSSSSSSIEGQVQIAIGSSEIQCPICLEDFENKSFTDPCFHSFCFTCILQWSEIVNKCPLCKTEFSSLITDVKAADDYKTVPIQSKAPQKIDEVSINEARRFRYRTTRWAGATRSGRNHFSRRDTRKPAPEERRKVVYRTGMRALPITTSDRKMRVRTITAAFYKENPAVTHRLLPWLTRDLKVLVGEEHVEFMIQLVLSLIERVNLEDSEFANHLQPFLHEKTDHFLHELISFAKSPLDMIAYDSKVSYSMDQRGPTTETATTHEEASRVQPALPSNSIGLASTQPGPSETPFSEGMRQRIFDELASTSWEDDPPIIRNLTTTPSESEDAHITNEEEQPEDTHTRSNDEEQSTASELIQSSVVTSSDPVERHEQVAGTNSAALSSGTESPIVTVHDCSPLESDPPNFSEDPVNKPAQYKTSSNSTKQRKKKKGHGSDRSPTPTRRKHTHSRRHSSHNSQLSPSADSSKRSHHHRHHHHRRHSTHQSSRSPSPRRHYSYKHSSRPSSSKGSSQSHREKLHKLSKQHLSTELISVEEEIVENKKQLLKSLLQKERTELLQHSLLSERFSDSVQTSAALQCGSSSHSNEGIDPVAVELAAVEKAILEGKQQVLKVMKRIELAQLTREQEL